MLYAIPDELTLGDWSVGWNRTLSETDKAFAAEQYPFPRDPEEPKKPAGPVAAWVDGEIARFERYLNTNNNQAARNVLDYLKRRRGQL